ncbi:MAG: hypothetical protein V2I36_01235 [Desulfopila sp.]|nr:hypothetical protein [Desulfopila sp.]
MSWIREEIEVWMSRRSNNALEPGSALPAFAAPLVGVARGDDDLFAFLKNDIGPEFYWTPRDAFIRAFPDEMVRADELSVVAWVLPQTKETRSAHGKNDTMPSAAWSKVRHYGEKINENLRGFVVDRYMTTGFQACAPALLPQWSRAISTRYGYASSWSERHAAYVCGLGTFGVSDGLITPVGKAVRLGSVIVRTILQPTPRLYRHHNEWCLFLSGGKCLACARRCPAGAISESGHDKSVCREYIRNVTSVYVEKEQLGFRVNSCGLCQTKVPCESRNPEQKNRCGKLEQL